MEFGVEMVMTDVCSHVRLLLALVLSRRQVAAMEARQQQRAVAVGRRRSGKDTARTWF